MCQRKKKKKNNKKLDKKNKKIEAPEKNAQSPTSPPEAAPSSTPPSLESIQVEGSCGLKPTESTFSNLVFVSGDREKIAVSPKKKIGSKKRSASPLSSAQPTEKSKISSKIVERAINWEDYRTKVSSALNTIKGKLTSTSANKSKSSKSRAATTASPRSAINPPKMGGTSAINSNITSINSQASTGFNPLGSSSTSGEQLFFPTSAIPKVAQSSIGPPLVVSGFDQIRQAKTTLKSTIGGPVGAGIGATTTASTDSSVKSKKDQLVPEKPPQEPPKPVESAAAAAPNKEKGSLVKSKLPQATSIIAASKDGPKDQVAPEKAQEPPKPVKSAATASNKEKDSLVKSKLPQATSIAASKDGPKDHVAAVKAQEPPKPVEPVAPTKSKEEKNKKASDGPKTDGPK